MFLRRKVYLNPKGIPPPFIIFAKPWISWLFLLYLILIILYPFFLILQFFGLLSLNLPFPTSFWLLFLHSSIVDIFSYIPLHPFNHTNYVYLIIILCHHYIILPHC